MKQEHVSPPPAQHEPVSRMKFGDNNHDWLKQPGTVHYIAATLYLGRRSGVGIYRQAKYILEHATGRAVDGTAEDLQAELFRRSGITREARYKNLRVAAWMLNIPALRSLTPERAQELARAIRATLADSRGGESIKHEALKELRAREKFQPKK